MKFPLILADPPWPYKVWSKKGQGRSAEHHYRTMPLDEILALDLKRIAADDCALLLWATAPNLPQAFAAMQAWGFDYKTVAFTWIKRNKKADTLFWGLGHYTRANPEWILLGTRGQGLPRVRKDVHSVIESPVLRHSQKPPESRHRIVDLFGDLPRIELFARDRVPGWEATGLELDGRDIRDAIAYWKDR